MLLEIDAQGSEGLTGLTKLRAEGKVEVRKMRAGSNEDQVEEEGRACERATRRRPFKEWEQKRDDIDHELKRYTASFVRCEAVLIFRPIGLVLMLHINTSAGKALDRRAAKSLRVWLFCICFIKG